MSFISRSFLKAETCQVGAEIVKADIQLIVTLTIDMDSSTSFCVS